MSKIVVVTGATGYIASHVVLQLLEKGYRVRATVRDKTNQKKTSHLRAMPNQPLLELFSADLTVEGSFDDAICEGVETVIHVASPFFHLTTDPQIDLIDPAVKGTKNVLTSASKIKSVKRVVLTSSIAAIYDRPPVLGKIYSEVDWNETATIETLPYFVSKIMAERAAWEMADTSPFKLVVVNPGFVLGPPVPAYSGDMGTSISTIKDIVTKGENFQLLSGGMAVVDVRDVARAHIAAMEIEEATGRHICVGSMVTWTAMAKTLKSLFPHHNVANQYPEDEGVPPYFDTSKIRKAFGIEFTSLEACLLDSILALEAIGLVDKVN